MARVKRGVTTKARHKKVVALAKGYRGRSKNCFRLAINRVEKGLQYAYRDRRVKKRNFRSLWIQRINAAAREQGLTYGRMMHGLKSRRYRDRSQGACRYCRARSARVYELGQAGPNRLDS